MKTVFSNHSEVAHIWAQQNQEKGKSGNMFFEGTRIFSYGYHYCIANFVKPGLVLINSRGYSNSTAKHENYVRRALHGVKRFTVPSVGWSKYGYQNEIDHAANLEYYRLKISNLVFDAKKAIKNSEFLARQAQGMHAGLLDYCDSFGLDKSEFEKIVIIDSELQIKIDKQRTKQAEREEKERLFNEQLMEFAKNQSLPAWYQFSEMPKLQGKTVYPSILPYAYLRVNGSEVETSHGAKVPLKAAKVLFELIQSGRDIKGYQIGNYTVIGINGVLTIGCHKIERSEIERFAKTQNWI